MDVFGYTGRLFNWIFIGLLFFLNTVMPSQGQHPQIAIFLQLRPQTRVANDILTPSHKPSFINEPVDILWKAVQGIRLSCSFHSKPLQSKTLFLPWQFKQLANFFFLVVSYGKKQDNQTSRMAFHNISILNLLGSMS